MSNEEKQHKRQLPLLEEVKKHQEACPHTLIIPINGVIICTECSAVWVK